MFEHSLVESRALVAPGTQRWSALGSFALQCAVAAVLIAVPMLRPEVIPVSVTPPHLVIPMLRQPEMVREVTAVATRAAVSLSTPPRTAAPVEPTRRFVFPTTEPTTASDERPAETGMLPMGDGSGTLEPLAVLGRGTGGGPVVVTRAHDAGPVRVSQGVLQGMLAAPITPVYPPIAKAAGVEGAVVMEAMISKNGRVESLHVVSGPPMLRPAAMDAVSGARYIPYRLNGDAVEVQTVITVMFRLRS